MNALIVVLAIAGLLCALVALTGVVALLARVPGVRDALDEWLPER